MVMPFQDPNQQNAYQQWLAQQPQYAPLAQQYQAAQVPQQNYAYQPAQVSPTPGAPAWGQQGSPVTQGTPQAAAPAWGAGSPRFALMQESQPQAVPAKPQGQDLTSQAQLGMGAKYPTNPTFSTANFVADAVPGQTGTGPTVPETQKPAWTARTAGKDGSSYYNVLRGKFDPWGNWGRYGPALNPPKRHQTAQGLESDVDRVYRWTNDILRSMGYAGGENAPVELRTQIYLANVERLKQEYATSQPPLDWNTSAYANMDKQVRADVASPGGGGTMPGTTPPATTPPATTPPPTAQPGTQTPGNTSGLTAAQRQALADDPNQAYRYMMQQLGYNPSAPGLLGNFMKRRFQPLLEARLAAANVTDDASYMDVIDQVINEFGGGMFQQGGNFYGNLRNIGTQAAGSAAPFLNNLTDQNQAMQYLGQLGMLRYAGSNPLIQQANADEMQRARDAYQDYSFDTELGGNNIDPFQQWLMSQSRYRNIFGY